ncbi:MULTISPECIES: hypothetical protein [Sphingomonadaceae]|uniref:hypothetical protein n=1 Tax=Sphingomonadales TaxID=204457 RepID=UPI0007702A6A|nr:hypothetical protein [Sphingobium sp. TKS]AMK23055.1 hypothetical protein K426_10565 [Sphingobium sp. TKS]MCF8707832.1 hypothetical protein [Rhizorhapis sp. SPR117]
MSGQRNGSGGECRNRRPHLRVGLYWMVAAAIAIASLRLFIWVLGKSGVISDADGEFVLLIALPIALLTIGWLPPVNLSKGNDIAFNLK